MQLGHEPVFPCKSYSFISNQYLWYYPRIFGYTRGIIQERGFLGLYRGVVPSVIEEVVWVFVTEYSTSLLHPVLDRLLPDGEIEVNLDDLSTNRNIVMEEAKRCLLASVSECLGVLAARPFAVIATRAIAQHIGQEKVYSSVLQAARHIYNEEGIAGFYSGIVPAMLQCVMQNLILYLVLAALAEAIKLLPSSTMGRDGSRFDLVRAGSVLLSAYYSFVYSHPLGLVSTLMAVNGSGLAAATVHFSGWQDCWNHLRVTGSLFRGIWFTRILFKYRAHNY